MMNVRRRAFTLLEVLIALALVGVMLPALFKAIELLQEGNRQVYRHLIETQQSTKALRLLYQDIVGSDGNLTIHHDTYDRLCIEHTVRSLYGVAYPKVCWVVTKNPETLVRIEGRSFRLPLSDEMPAFAEEALTRIEYFRVYYKRGEVLVLLKQEDMEPTAFRVYGITPPPKHRKKKKKPSPRSVASKENS